MNEQNLDLISLVLKGGPVMLILLGLSIISLTIIIIKIFQFYKSDIYETVFVDDLGTKQGAPRCNLILIF